MSNPACPMCEMNDILEHPARWECATCGHEWRRDAAPEIADGPRMVKDAHGNVLTDGDCVILIKDLKLGGSQVLKGGTKSKPIKPATETTSSPARWRASPSGLRHASCRRRDQTIPVASTDSYS